MARFQMTQSRVDTAVRMQTRASVTLFLGWLLLGMSGLIGIYVFTAVRDGDWFWPIFTGLMGLIGVVLVVAGWWTRRTAE